ncbi:MAG: hypothetical protein ACREML_08325, partial [Vulcanimicrobiaceae bacterium]
MLLAIDRSAQPAADAAAVLLGRDLWIEPLRAFRDRCEHRHLSRPPLWRFAWGPSAAWDARLWLSTSLEGRILRTRAGSLTLKIERNLDAATLAMASSAFTKGVADLRQHGLLSGSAPSILAPVAHEYE